MEPEAPNSVSQRRLKIAIVLVLAAMIALAAWAWWIPNRVFDPWLEMFRRWMDRMNFA